MSFKERAALGTPSRPLGSPTHIPGLLMPAPFDSGTEGGGEGGAWTLMDPWRKGSAGGAGGGGAWGALRALEAEALSKKGALCAWTALAPELEAWREAPPEEKALARARLLRLQSEDGPLFHWRSSVFFEGPLPPEDKKEEEVPYPMRGLPSGVEIRSGFRSHLDGAPRWVWVKQIHDALRRPPACPHFARVRNAMGASPFSESFWFSLFTPHLGVRFMLEPRLPLEAGEEVRPPSGLGPLDLRIPWFAANFLAHAPFQEGEEAQGMGTHLQQYLVNRSLLEGFERGSSPGPARLRVLRGLFYWDAWLQGMEFLLGGQDCARLVFTQPSPPTLRERLFKDDRECLQILEECPPRGLTRVEAIFLAAAVRAESRTPS